MKAGSRSNATLVSVDDRTLRVVTDLNSTYLSSEALADVARLGIQLADGAVLTVSDYDGFENGDPAWIVVRGLVHFDAVRSAWQISYTMDDVSWEARDPTGAEAVGMFVRRARLAIDAAAAPIREILGSVRRRAAPRVGVIGGRWRYEQHGRGVLLVDSEGVEVDLDVDDQGITTFDAYRVLRCVATSGRSVEPSEVIKALDEAVARSELEAGEVGWYRLRIGEEGRSVGHWVPSPDDQTIGFAYDCLVEALCLAALPAADQVAVLPEFVHVEDEIALVFDDANALSPQLLSAGVLDDAVFEGLRELDELLAREVDSTMWAAGALATHPSWAAVREASLGVLSLLRQPLRKPAFATTRWIRG